MKKLTVIYKLGFPLLVIAAVLKEFEGVEHNAFRIINFFSYFTIESNIFAAIIMLISIVYVWKNKSTQTFDYLRGAATLFMVITGIVYTLLLSDSGHSWMNTVLHYIFPIVMFADWLIDRARPVTFKKSLWWLVFPVLFLVYSLTRGAFVDWYPYPFLDPRTQGYGKVAVTSVFIAIAGVLLTVMLGIYSQIGRSKRLAQK